MDQKKALEIMAEAYAAYEKILPKPIHDAYLFGDYATGRYDEESGVYILIVVDMSQEELQSYEKKLIHIDSELEMKYDVFVCDFSVPLEIFERTNGYYLHQNIRDEGIRYAA